MGKVKKTAAKQTSAKAKKPASTKKAEADLKKEGNASSVNPTAVRPATETVGATPPDSVPPPADHSAAALDTPASGNSAVQGAEDSQRNKEEKDSSGDRGE